MAGYVYRGDQPLPSGGFDHGTRAGLLVHARLGTPLCGPCKAIKVPAVARVPSDHPARTQCREGHALTGKKGEWCGICRNKRKRERVTCQGCGNNITRGSAYSHRARHPACVDALLVKVAA